PAFFFLWANTLSSRLLRGLNKPASNRCLQKKARRFASLLQATTRISYASAIAGKTPLKAAPYWILAAIFWAGTTAFIPIQWARGGDLGYLPRPHTTLSGSSPNRMWFESAVQKTSSAR